VRINEFGVNPITSAAQNTKKHVNGDAFLRLMQENIKPEQAAGTAEAFSTGRIGEIEAIAARSRIVKSHTKNDVTGFLGLIKENRHLLSGIDIESLGLDKITPGQKPLTESDAIALRGEYDPGNLTPEKQAELLKKLNDLGVLSAEDIISLKNSVTPSDGDLMDYLKSEDGFTSVDAAGENNMLARLEAMIQNERYAALHVNMRYGQNANEVSGLAEAHEKALNALKQI
jgi:hypothetical protein